MLSFLRFIFYFQETTELRRDLNSDRQSRGLMSRQLDLTAANSLYALIGAKSKETCKNNYCYF